MLKRYAIWDKKTNVITPIGEVLTPEQWTNRYPWIKVDGLVPVVAAGVFNGGLIDELSQLKARCEAMGAEFADGLTNEELLEAIEAFEDSLNAPNATVSDQTRIANALEDMVVLQEIASME